jgi:hypothetical protein
MSISIIVKVIGVQKIGKNAVKKNRSDGLTGLPRRAVPVCGRCGTRLIRPRKKSSHLIDTHYLYDFCVNQCGKCRNPYVKYLLNIHHTYVWRYLDY